MRTVPLLAALGAGMLAISALVALQPATAASAYTGADFDPSYIISDQAFFDSNSMDEAAIQAFLVAREPSCAQSNGVPCLKNFTADTFDRASAGAGHCAAYAGAAAESAARIIAKVARACKISPRVLLVTLQKEQGLVNAGSPTVQQYRAAMGYGCPDTAVCDARYYGFYNQVYNAAWQFRQYTNFPDRRYKIGPVSIQYNPNAGCGATVVNIVNQATANLYNYTPYQPNAAAMANLRGTGNACSSYGNRNFWVYYNDWFGVDATTGPAAITAKYAALGGAGGPLGAATSGLLPISANGSGLGVAYTNGSIYWSPGFGAWSVMAGTVRDYYFERGGAAGPLGFPASDLGVISQNGGGSGQAFQYGSVYWTSQYGAVSVTAAMRSAYFTQGGASGALGWPTAEAICGLPQSGCTQAFQGGAVYSSTAGAYPVSGAIAQTYATMGAQAGALGWPGSGPMAISVNGGGIGQALQAGSIYSSAAGTFAVQGAIRDFYFTLNGAGGRLGWPTGAQVCSDSTHCSQTFVGGAVYWSSTTGARIGWPAIESVYASLGSESGTLGARSSELLTIGQSGGGYGQAFAGGSIFWSSPTGAFAVQGSIKERYFVQGGAAGSLGWPTAAEACSLPGGGCSQAFQGGVIYAPTGSAAVVVGAPYLAAYTAAGGAGGALGVPRSEVLPIQQNGGGSGMAFASGSIFSSAGGTRIISGAYRDTYFQYGGAGGVMGFPTSDVVTISENGGGTGQAFQGGAVYSSTAGTFAVNGPIRDGYYSLSGSSGRLGWPIAAAVCTTASACTQSFQHGTIRWSASAGVSFG